MELLIQLVEPKLSDEEEEVLLIHRVVMCLEEEMELNLAGGSGRSFGTATNENTDLIW